MKRKSIFSLLLVLSLLLMLAVPIIPGYAVEGDEEEGGETPTPVVLVQPEQPAPIEGNGLTISKRADANTDGTFTITLEAYATGATVSTVIEEDVPTDIILLLDQSGSMADDMGTVSFTAYTGNNRRNSSYYNNRYNGGNENLYYPLGDGSYAPVNVTREQIYQYTAQTNRRNNWYYNNRANLFYQISEDVYGKVTLTCDGNVLTGYTYTYVFSDADNDAVGTVTSSGVTTTPNFGDYAPIYTASASDYEYTYSYFSAAGVMTEIGRSTGANTIYLPVSNTTGFYQRNTTENGGGSRIAALQSALNSFVASVETKAKGEDGTFGTEDDVDHRIAFVGFASGGIWSYNGTNYNYGNTEVFVGANQYRYGTQAESVYGTAFQDMTTEQGRSNAVASIGALAADGGTLTNLGMEMVNGILNANPVPSGETRNRVVILFTDGAPGWSGYESTVANAAISLARTTKDTYGATVYAVSVIAGTDPNRPGSASGNATQQANFFLQNISSNDGNPQTPSYFLAASDAASLSNIFTQISQNIQSGGSNTTLTEEAVIRDIVATQFKLPDGASANNITLKTYAYNGIDENGNKIWTENADAMGATATVVNNPMGGGRDEVSVTGFNFKENWVGTETAGDDTETNHGHKLEISFVVEPEEYFLGGDGAFTNFAASIYENASSTKPIMTFPTPTVNVPVKSVSIQPNNRYVYCGNGFNDFSSLQDLSLAGRYINTYNNRYVNVTYKLMDTEGNVIGEAYVPAGSSTIQWTWTEGETPALRQIFSRTFYKVTADVVSVGDANNKAHNEGSASVYVLTPEITFKDSEIDLGTTANYDDNKLNPDFVEWKVAGTSYTPESLEADGLLASTAEEPVLTYSYEPEAGIFKTDTPVKVSVSAETAYSDGPDDITEYTSFYREACTHDGCDNTTKTQVTTGADGSRVNFIVHVNPYELTINKTGASPVDENQSFIFHVTNNRTDDLKVDLDVTVEANGSVTIKGLPTGEYTVTEQSGWSWRYTPTNPQPVSTDTATDHSMTVTVNNTRNKIYWLDGNDSVDNRWTTGNVVEN